MHESFAVTFCKWNWNKETNVVLMAVLTLKEEGKQYPALFDK